MAEFIKLSWLFPVIESVHLIGLTMLVGTIALIDMRLLGIGGIGTKRQDAADLAAGLAPWTLAGLLTVLVSGPLVFWSDLTRYIHNPAFILKAGLLALALAAHFTLHRSAIRSDAVHAARRRKLAAVISLLLWSCVVVAGRAIADFDIRPL